MEDIYNEYIAPLLTTDVLLALIAFLATFVVLKIIKEIVIKKLKRFDDKFEKYLPDLIINVIDRIGPPFFILVSLRVALTFTPVSNQINIIVRGITLAVITYYAVVLVNEIISYFASQYSSRQKEKDEHFDENVITFLVRIAGIVVWGLGLVVLLSNLGYDVTAIVAGLGVAGIAVGFALQNILGDLFAYFAIFFDKPFAIGDFIKFNDKSGTIEKIGIRSTRIRTLQGEELVVGNQQLTENEIHNFRKLERRRHNYEIGVTYQTPNSKLNKIPEIITNIYDNVENVTLDRVHFKEFGSSALVFEIIHFVESSEYLDFMDALHEINTKIYKSFEKEKIEFAYPTQTLFIENEEKASKKSE